MNPTIEKFGFPATLVREFDHWVVLVRPNQVTLGSLILAAKSDAIAYSALPQEAFTEQSQVIGWIERVLAGFVAFERINYLMLMMIDPNVHFHVIPRYPGSRSWDDLLFPDQGWPGPPKLDQSVSLSEDRLRRLAGQVSGACN